MCALLGTAFLIAILELFIPSGGVLAFLAGCALIGSVIFAFQTDMAFGAIYLIFVTIGAPIVVWYLMMLFPKTPMGRAMFMNPEDDPALQPDPEREAAKQLVGRQGVARSLMMLSGQIEIDGKRYSAISESMAVNPGTPIVVVSVDGINIIVRPVPVAAPNRTESATPVEPVPEIEDPFV